MYLFYRIIVWCEPFYESSELENLKLLFAGDYFSVRVKYKPDCMIHKTPVICLSNVRLSFMDDPNFVHRIFTHEWRTAPFLQHYTRKPHPLTFIHLLIRMGILTFTEENHQDEEFEEDM